MKISNLNTKLNSDALVTNEIEATNNADYSQSEEDLAFITLDDDGLICEYNKAAAILLDGAPNNLTWQPISKFLPWLKETPLMLGKSVNPTLRFLSRIGYSFEVIGVGGIHFACVLFFNEIESLGRRHLRLIFRPIMPQYTLA
ncbi:MAG: hypothetical protein Q8J59_04180 [Methylotenera sp.]|nr:hypothetical protein [Methylotenera sp.]MDO9388776.1 hypothetical protein [Methylotenera sp.]MDP2101712.1 hypothetical protein [Methylotenera sp.]MDP2280871.1 hypothetical protein [Methylotenera sp.]MDP3060969.1 hypothetical protein [Methylotenera sp.]